MNFASRHHRTRPQATITALTLRQTTSAALVAAIATAGPGATIARGQCIFASL